MIRTMLWALACAFTLLFTVPVTAAQFDEGIEYKLVRPPQPVDDPSKIEVRELFWYGCPHCYHLEPKLKAWLEHLPPNVRFVRMPAVLGDRWSLLARAYYTADLLGVLDRTHEALFDAIHKEGQRIRTESQLADFFARFGVDRKTFHDTFHSFAVEAKIARARELSRRYHIDGVPTIIVDGKYRTSATDAGGQEAMFKVVDYLIARETAARKTAAAAAH